MSHNTSSHIIPASRVGAAGNPSINPRNALIQSYHITGVITACETSLLAASSAWPPAEWHWTSIKLHCALWLRSIACKATRPSAIVRSTIQRIGGTARRRQQLTTDISQLTHYNYLVRTGVNDCVHAPINSIDAYDSELGLRGINYSTLLHLIVPVFYIFWSVAHISPLFL